MDVNIIGYKKEAKTLHLKQDLNLDGNDPLGTLTQDSMPRMTGA